MRARDLGLHPRALAAWAGTDRLSALPARMHELASRPITPASAMLALFVAGVDVSVARLPAGLAELVEIRGSVARAKVAILPIGESVIVCDRLDAPADAELVCWPDDSSYHLARAVPRERVATWLDLGCGSAFAPLAEPALAAAIVAADLNPRAVRYAQLGAALSGIAHVTARASNLDEELRGERFDLVTCNAPIPGDTGPLWRATDAGFVARLADAARGLVAPGGTIVVHAAADPLRAALAGQRGDRAIVTYTPGDAPRAFGVAWWMPDAADRLVAKSLVLTPEHPHVTHEDRL